MKYSGVVVYPRIGEKNSGKNGRMRTDCFFHGADCLRTKYKIQNTSIQKVFTERIADNKEKKYKKTKKHLLVRVPAICSNVFVWTQRQQYDNKHRKRRPRKGKTENGKRKTEKTTGAGVKLYYLLGKRLNRVYPGRTTTYQGTLFIQTLHARS